MFSKKSPFEKKVKTIDTVVDEHEKKEPAPEMPENAVKPAAAEAGSPTSVNRILKGSKLTGDINVTCDLEVSGDVDGNITSLQDSNILIKGICKGNIETKEGSVDIEGELHGGNITAGKDVKISGRFNGGEVKATGRIYVDGEFKGKLEGSDVEIGANASGKGEILYNEYISISKGARVNVQISQAKEALREVKAPPKPETAAAKPVEQQSAQEK